MIARIFEVVTIFLLLVGIVTQLIVPAFKGTSYFPLFRKSGKLQADLADAHQEMDDIRLAQEVEKLHKDAEELKAAAVSTAVPKAPRKPRAPRKSKAVKTETPKS